MSAIATMKALADAEKKRPTREAAQHVAASASSLRRPSPHSEEQSHNNVHPAPFSPEKSALPSTSTLDSSLATTSTAIDLPPPLEVIPVVPKLNTVVPSAGYYSDSANSSASSSPTLGSQDAVTFTFSSPLFYDQKLYIYHTLLAIYNRLAKCIEEHPVILLMLQYSVALLHGFTVYLVSVILSIAQLIMIAFTIENLDWIQSYKPLMCEWDSRFPGFVFPALDIDSEEDDDDLYASKSVSRVYKGGRYWKAQTALKAGDDSADDGYHSEESQQQLIIRQSMNSTLRKRLAKYQNWLPLLWSPEENSVHEALEETEEVRGPEETEDHYSARIRRALVRTFSGGNYQPTKGKRRVTFNEQVMIFGRRRSSQVSQEFPIGNGSLPITAPGVSSEAVKSSTTSASQAEQASSAGMVVKEQQSHSSAGLMITSDFSTSPMDREKLATLAREEAEYQQRTASEDTNGSGTSSPTFTPINPDETASTVSTTSACSAVAKSVTARVIKQSGDLRRSSSVPMKIGSFLSRHQTSNQEPRCTSPRHSSTFSESSTVSQNPRILPDHLEPQLDSKQEAVSPRSSMSLGTRAKRSFSLALPRPNTNNHNSTATLVTSTEPNNKDPSPLDRQGSAGKKNKNFMYRIVHPQRYRRELEQQLTDRERQRLLALAHLQRDHILAADSLDTNARFSSTEAAAALRASDSVLCGDPYYYATSAEYIEGLGAPNSMISTSFGTSFPEELQRHGRSASGSKGRSKVLRPASYDFDCNPVEANTRACGYGSEGETSSSRMTGKLEKSMSSGLHHGFFRRESKKKNEGIIKDRTQSPNRLQQLFSHPGQKKSHSSSSSVDAIMPAVLDTGALDLPAVPNQGDRSIPPVFSSPTAASAHKLLSRARSNSRAFTTFTALGTPAYPSAQPMMATQFSGALAEHEMEHTSFAAFGFPSPTSSPVHSTPASPRHSTSSTAEFHAHLARQQPVPLVGSEEFVGQQGTDSEEYHYYYHQQPLVQQQYYPQQQEVLLPEDGVQDHEDIYYLPSSAPVAMESVPLTEKGGQDDDQSSRSSSGTSNRGQGDFEGAPVVGGAEPAVVDAAVVTKRPRGLSFMRKLSLKKNK
ncbi:hypothetical protein BG015_008009 [Linnemannia schmuckeri]|uniref:Uncharacterized protein n=1 Tax=Linnemannia schmuckeri TaxID=64567 RepID=A0A9P5RY58_9FUNG|nr:hypothetical protein BG015_008009 [Linnemannia schmuckeri]